MILDTHSKYFALRAFPRYQYDGLLYLHYQINGENKCMYCPPRNQSRRASFPAIACVYIFTSTYLHYSLPEPSPPKYCRQKGVSYYISPFFRIRLQPPARFKGAGVSSNRYSFGCPTGIKGVGTNMDPIHHAPIASRQTNIYQRYIAQLA